MGSSPPAPSRVATPTANGGLQIPQPIKRHLPFSSMKPPFSPPEDYHRFSNPLGAATDVRIHEADAVVVKSTVSLVLSPSNGFHSLVTHLFGFSWNVLL